MEAFKHALQGAIAVFNHDLQQQPEPDDELCLIKAVFEDLLLTCLKKTVIEKGKYSFELKPYHAFAIRAGFAGCTGDAFTVNLIGQLCTRIHSTYSTTILKQLKPIE